MFGVKVVYNITNLTKDDYLELNETKKFLIENSDMVLVSNSEEKDFLSNLNKNISIVESIFYHNKNHVESLNKEDSNLENILNIFNNSKRNKKSVLYKYVSLFFKSSNTSFLDFLKGYEHKIIFDSKMFDKEWYLSQYEDVKKINMNPIDHYLRLGANESCIPFECFNLNSKLQIKDLNPLVSFILYNHLDNTEDYYLIKNSGLFDEDWYSYRYGVDSIHPITHFLEIGCDKKFNPSKNFDVSWYLSNYSDVKKSKMNPFVHYIKYGIKEGRFPNEINFYEKNYIKKSDFEENSNILMSLDLFDEDFYLNKYNDVKNSRFSALEHYIKFGNNEKFRKPNSFFSHNFYRENYLNNFEDDWNPLTHYAVIGKFKNYKTNIFDLGYIDYDNEQKERILNAFKKPISIVISIFDAPGKELSNCISSIRKNTNLKINIFIVNYTSNKLSGIDKDIKVINYFSHTFSNDIKDLIDSDIFFLGNFTQVTNKWLEKLVFRAYVDDNIDMVTPISNCINNISPDSYNKIIEPNSLTVEGLSKLIERISMRKRIEVPFINILGVYIKNNKLSIKHFNKNSFVYYKDEGVFGWNISNDLINVLDDSTYVFHDLPSYKEIFNQGLNNKNSLILSTNYRNFLNSENVKDLISNINSSLNEINSKVLSNKILFILDKNNLKFYNDILTFYNKNHFDLIYLTISEDKMCLWKNYSNELIKFNEWVIYNENYLVDYIKGIIFNIICSFNIDIVQLINLNQISHPILEIINSLKIPYIFESDTGAFSRLFSHDSIVNLINDDVYSEGMDDGFNNIILFDDKSKDIISLKNLDSKKNSLKITDNNFKIFRSMILKEFSSRLQKFLTNEKIKILIPGDLINYSEYFELIRLIEKKNENIEFHFLGDNFYLINVGLNHGSYTKDSLETLTNEICPDFIGLFSTFENIFDVIDISQKKKIPIITVSDDLLVGLVEGLDGVNILEEDTFENLYNSFIDILKFENFYCNIYNSYFEDKIFKRDIVNYNKILEDIYLTLCENPKKLIYSQSYSRNVNLERKVPFSNFRGFLANSYVSPMFEANFVETYKECFAVMDNVSKYLIGKIRNSNFRPLVSIIMPVYNREDIVSFAVNSVLNQSYENFELIIVDDCSNDNTLKILNDFEDSRISIISHDVNKGASEARNTGLNFAKGEYVAYLDSDNEWDNRYLESMISAFLELPDADAIYSAQLLYEDFSSTPFAVRFGAYNKSLLLNRNYIDLNCFCHKLKIFNDIGGFDVNLSRLEDWDFILRVSNNYKMYSVPILLSKYYYQNAENRVSDKTDYNLSYTYYLQDKYKKCPKNLDFNLTKKVSIVIPNYESLKDLRECIDAILSFNLELVEIIIVDNNSCDAVKYYLKTLENYENISVVFNEFNYGFTYAVNQGIDLADSDSDILLLNNDAILTEGAIEAMQKYAYSLPKCGLVVPQQILPGETPTLNVHVPYASSIFECDVNPSQHHENIINMPLFHNGEILELNFAPFFCTYIKRDILNESVGLDAELGRHYRSDRIFSDYVREVMGYNIYHISDAAVYHKLQKSTSKLKENQDDFDMMFVKNQWEDELLIKLGFKKALWDD